MPMALENEMHLDEHMKSWIVSIFSLGIVLMRPFSGFIADNFGKKKVAFWGFVGFTLCTISYFGIHSIGVLLAMRLVHGLFHSASTTAHSALAVDFSPNHMKGQGIGYYGLAMCLAMVIAPALGLFIYENYGYTILLYLANGMAIIGTAITFFIRLEPKAKAEIVAPKAKFSWSNLIEKNAIAISLCGALIAFCYSGIIAFIAFYLKERAIENGAIYFYIAFAASIIISRPFVGKIIDKKGAAYLIYPALSLFAIAMLLLSFVNNLPMVLVSGALLGLSYGTVFPSFQTMSIKACAPEKSSAAVATFFLFYDLGFGIGAIILNKIANVFDYDGMYFSISLFILFIIAMYSITIRSMRKKGQYIV